MADAKSFRVIQVNGRRYHLAKIKTGTAGDPRWRYAYRRNERDEWHPLQACNLTDARSAMELISEVDGFRGAGE
jgi:hypothetical protein